jgi:thiamine biosynthesis lipoprotein
MNCKILARVLAFLVSLSSANVLADWHTKSIQAMTTHIEWSYWLDDHVHDQEQAVSAAELRAGKGAEPKIKDGSDSESIDAALSLVFQSVDERMSRHSDKSELSHVNKVAADYPVAVSSSLFRVLDASIRMSQLSEGAFDMTFASVGYLYNYREKLRPDQAVIEPVKELIDYRLVQLDPIKQSVFFAKSGVRIDLGGVAKGYSVDEAIDVLRRFGVQYARVSAGGDMRLLGSKRGDDWVVGIKDPRQPDELAVRLPLSNVAISTSGDYERYFIDEDGTRVHHILSPSTGRPARELQSVTVIGDLSIDTDALSTAVFVLGVERGLALINRLDGFDAILIDQKRKMHYSAGLMPPE